VFGPTLFFIIYFAKELIQKKYFRSCLSSILYYDGKMGERFNCNFMEICINECWIIQNEIEHDNIGDPVLANNCPR
jgi:hypothetical protein